MKGRLLLLLAGVGLIAGCATRSDAPRRQPVGPRSTATIPAPTEPGPVSPAAYLARAASYDQLMIRAAEHVARSSQDTQLRRLATELAENHRGLAGQLSHAGRRLNLLPSPALQPRHQQWLDELLAAADIRAGYLGLARRVHQNSYHLHAAFARSGDSPTLKLVARNAAGAERRHWTELNR